VFAFFRKRRITPRVPSLASRAMPKRARQDVDHDDFFSWLASRDVKLDGVDLGTFRHGRGARATRQLSVGEIVVRVPDDVVLTWENSCASAALRASMASSARESPRLEKEMLVIGVMCEIVRGAESKYREYLKFVYDGVLRGHCVLSWDNDQAVLLEGTDAWRDAYENDDEGLDLPTMTDEHWKCVVKPFFKANTALARGRGMKELRELHYAATAAVAGYSFTLGDDEIQGMVPFFDSLNHAPPCEASVRLFHDEKTSTLQMITVREVNKGDEVFNTYGPLRNAELLRRYGFVLARNPHGGTTVSLGDVIEAAIEVNPNVVDDLPIRLAWLESHGLSDETLLGRFFIHPTGRPSKEILIALRVLGLTKKEMTALIETDFKDEEQLMILEGNDKQRAKQSYAVGAALQYLSMHAKERYNETMRESRLIIQMFAGVSPIDPKQEYRYREWCAAIVRMGEQRTLSKLARWTYAPNRSEDSLLHAWPFPVDEDDDEDSDEMCEAVEV